MWHARIYFILLSASQKLFSSSILVQDVFPLCFFCGIAVSSSSRLRQTPANLCQGSCQTLRRLLGVNEFGECSSKRGYSDDVFVSAHASGKEGWHSDNVWTGLRWPLLRQLRPLLRQLRHWQVLQEMSHMLLFLKHVRGLHLGCTCNQQKTHPGFQALVNDAWQSMSWESYQDLLC